MRFKRKCKSFLLVLFSTPLMMGGCDCGGKTPPQTSNAPAAGPATTATPVQPLIKKGEIADWCPEHGVPESICTRCNAKLIDGFKEKGDWCKEHDLPESQCFVCHPELKAKFEAMAPRKP